MYEDGKNLAYARRFAEMIRCKTVSNPDDGGDVAEFKRLRRVLRELFPALFAASDEEDFEGSLLLRWRGRREGDPLLLMSHHDVVEAHGEWLYGPFSGEIADGKIWGRGTLDTKGSLWAMLTAADELASSGWQPEADVYFVSTCNEEIHEEGAKEISATLMERGICLRMVLDEGGCLQTDPLDMGASGREYAMIGLGEKGIVDMKFSAYSGGGHASVPPKNSPLVRLGRFMVECDDSEIFEVQLSPALKEMLRRLAPSFNGELAELASDPDANEERLMEVLPELSPKAAAMTRTTIAFTMSGGSEGYNVMPREAWVVGNIRISHHQGGKSSLEVLERLAAKYDIKMTQLDDLLESGLSDFRTEAFAKLTSAIKAIFPDAEPVPYIMAGASDCKFFTKLSDNCFRFVPFRISREQMRTVHGLNENLDISCLSPAVEFYKYVLKNI